MWFNPIMRWLLRSPLHGFVSKNMMLITYKGRKSGKPYTTPVNYLRIAQDQDQFLATTSSRDRVWWRSLRGSVEVTIRLQGKDYPATSEVIEDDQEVAENLAVYLRQWPAIAKYFDVQLDAEGQPELEDVVNSAKTRVFIKTRLA